MIENFLIWVGAGGLAGIAVGYFLKIAIKIGLICAGGVYLLLAVLQYKDYISVNFEKIFTDAYNLTNYTLVKVTYILQSVAGELNFDGALGGIGFTGGLALGYKLKG